MAWRRSSAQEPRWSSTDAAAKAPVVAEAVSAAVSAAVGAVLEDRAKVADAPKVPVPSQAWSVARPKPSSAPLMALCDDDDGSGGSAELWGLAGGAHRGSKAPFSQRAVGEQLAESAEEAALDAEGTAGASLGVAGCSANRGVAAGCGVSEADIYLVKDSNFEVNRIKAVSVEHKCAMREVEEVQEEVKQNDKQELEQPLAVEATELSYGIKASSGRTEWHDMVDSGEEEEEPPEAGGYEEMMENLDLVGLLPPVRSFPVLVYECGNFEKKLEPIPCFPVLDVWERIYKENLDAFVKAEKAEVERRLATDSVVGVLVGKGRHLQEEEMSGFLQQNVIAKIDDMEKAPETDVEKDHGPNTMDDQKEKFLALVELGLELMQNGARDDKIKWKNEAISFLDCG
ncbi:unnamed protein product [Prorocentrum cordatum]|uniref:Uncharacterized protein n=1 Tax=Prorocentrum cordatum TaxID=2364126 RepID=A0ABN9UTY8_9DINO|nr:unnamed protein product [Polarella glacialis]